MSYNVNINNINNNIRSNKSPRVEDGFFLLSEVAKKCSYSQEYLSLLARREELKAEKFGRNWYTKMEWLREYIDLHPVAKKGNNRGEILVDQQAKKILEASGLNESVIESLKKFIINTARKCHARGVIINKYILQTLSRVRSVFILSKKETVVFERSNVKQFEVARRQVLIEELTSRIEALENNIDFLSLPNFLKRKRMSNHFPFARGANKSILECATEIIESSIEKVKVNLVFWLAQFLQERVGLFWFKIKLSFKSLVVSPVFVVRYWSSVGLSKKLRVATISLLVIFLFGVSVVSQLDYQLATNLYNGSVETARNSISTTQEILVTGISKFSEGVEEMDVKTKRLIDNQTEGIVAGVSTYSFPKVASQKLMDGLVSTRVVQGGLSRESDWQLKQGKKSTQALLALGFSYTLDGATEIKKFGNNGRTVQVRGVWNDLDIFWQKIDFELSRKDNFIYKSNEALVAGVVNRVIGGMTGWHDLGDMETVNLLANKGKSANLAFQSYMDSFVDPSRQILADKTGKYTKLDRLIVSVVRGSNDSLDTLASYLDDLLDRTKDSLGDSYLALLDTLNLQPAYPHRATDKMLLGQGDKPLDLIENQKGIDNRALAVVPLEEETPEERDDLAERIKNTFSDEVEIVPDEDSASGIIRPTDTAISFEDYMYVVVPLRGEDK